MSPRSYEQRLRAEQAAATREAILRALAERIRKDPSRPVAIDEVAKTAGVARSTVYTVFGSRAGLFYALAQDLHERGGYSRLIEATRLPDPREALRAGITAGVGIFASDAEVFRSLHAMQKLDSEAIGDAIERIEEQRAAGMAGLARRLKSAGELREGVGATRAAHVIWIAASFEAFDLLYSGRGLSPPTVAEILIDGVERAVCRER